MDRYPSPIVDRHAFLRNPLLQTLLFLLLLLAFSALISPRTAQAQETVPAGRAFSMPFLQRHTVDDPSAFVYDVRLGEYWILIARKFGVSYDQLRAANTELWALRGELIWTGDQMVIPGLTAADQWEIVEYTVQHGDSWYRVADNFGVSYWDLRLDNPGLWRRRGVVIRPGDVMQIVNPNPPTQAAQPVVASTATESTATESAAAAQPVAAAPVQSPSAPVAAPPATLPATSSGTPYRVTNPPAGAIIYSVRPGDNWFSISSRYGITFESLRSVNQELWTLRGQNIRPADEMVIPAHGSPPPPMEIKEVTEEKPAPAPYSNYTVQDGDTWATVAAASGITEDALKAANVEMSGRALVTGDVIRIP